MQRGCRVGRFLTLAACFWRPGGPALTRLMMSRSQRSPDNLSTSFHLSLRPSGDLRCDWGVALSQVLLLMTSQGPADRRAGKRSRCDPLETGFILRQRPLSSGPRLLLQSPPNSSFSLHSLISGGKLAGALGVPPPTPHQSAELGSAGVGQGVAEGWQVGYCPQQTESQTDATLEAALTSSLKELIIDFLAASL